MSGRKGDTLKGGQRAALGGMGDVAELLIEPERYELSAEPAYQFDLDRREFFKTLGCGMVVLFLVESVLGQWSRGALGGGICPGVVGVRRRSARGCISAGRWHE